MNSLHLTRLLRALRIRIPALALLALLLPVGGCDGPCHRLMEKLERCTRSAPKRALHDAPGVRDRIRTRCRRADPGRVKACLEVTDCRKLLDCAASAVRSPAERF